MNNLLILYLVICIIAVTHGYMNNKIRLGKYNDNINVIFIHFNYQIYYSTTIRWFIYIKKTIICIRC